MLSEDDIRHALRACFDPTLKLSIVDLGIVRSITLIPDPDAPGANIPGVPPRQSLTLTLELPPNEDATTVMLAQIQNLLAGIPDLSRTDIKIVSPAFPILKTR